MRKLISLILAILALSTAALADTLTIRPNGQGQYSEWNQVNCPAGHWQCVDEAQANASDYLYQNKGTKREAFTFSDAGLTTESINSVTLVYFAKRYSTTKYNMLPLIRANGQDFLGNVMMLGQGFASVSQTFTTNPATGSPWTVAEVNALEAGMRTHTTNPGGIVAQVHAVVNFNPLPPPNQPPTANAGPDKNVTDSNNDGSEPVTLNGSASFDPDGTITTYEWKEGANTLGTTAVITANLSVGTHNINLTVTDNEGATGTDTVLVNVNAPAAGTLTVNITSPVEQQQITVNTSFETNATVRCAGGPCNGVNATVQYDTGKLSLTGNSTHNIGNMAADTMSVQTWQFSATSTGSANITANAQGSEGQSPPATDTVTIQIVSPAPPPTPPSVTYFRDDVEAGESGWTVAGGLWHITTRRSNSSTHSRWYGNESTGTYETFSGGINGTNTSTRNFGNLTSPLINLTAATAPVLRFYNYWDTEIGTTWDTKKVLVSTNNGQTWTQVLQVSDQQRVWHQRTVDLSSYAGNTIMVRFAFDTVDGIANNYEGWFIDDVEVSG